MSIFKNDKLRKMGGREDEEVVVVKSKDTSAASSTTTTTTTPNTKRSKKSAIVDFGEPDKEYGILIAKSSIDIQKKFSRFLKPLFKDCVGVAIVWDNSVNNGNQMGVPRVFVKFCYDKNLEADENSLLALKSLVDTAKLEANKKYGTSINAATNGMAIREQMFQQQAATNNKSMSSDAAVRKLITLTDDAKDILGDYVPDSYAINNGNNIIIKKIKDGNKTNFDLVTIYNQVPVVYNGTNNCLTVDVELDFFKLYKMLSDTNVPERKGYWYNVQLVMPDSRNRVTSPIDDPYGIKVEIPNGAGGKVTLTEYTFRITGTNNKKFLELSNELNYGLPKNIVPTIMNNYI